MIMSTKNINILLNGVVRAGAGVDNCLLETRNATRPAEGEYATIYWKDIQYLKAYRGDSTHSETETEYLEHRINSALCTVQFSVFGDTALDKCIALNSWLNSENRLFDLDTLIGISDIGNVQDISIQQNGQIQPRASFDFSFYVELGAVYPMDYFIVDNIQVNFIK